ncbi:MAG: STAS domain-containing protein [Betaproteobacteria bacterium]|nr:STAS domain-containing protein [Betaproteobacteria bacterium]
MINVAGDRVEVSGAMTLTEASKLLTEGNATLSSAETLFDLSAVTAVDSSSIAVIFGWLRAARQQGKSIRIVAPPQELLSLSSVYGVTELLPLAA